MPEPRPVGRPPKLRECDTCRQPRRTRDFGSATATTCRECRAKQAPSIESPSVLGRIFKQAPSPERRSELLDDALGQRAMMAAIQQVCAGFARCSCCLTAEHIRYVSGKPFCELCAVAVEVCGRCFEHQSVVFFPDLEGNQPPAIPVDVRMLFDAPDVLRRLKSADPLEASPEP